MQKINNYSTVEKIYIIREGKLYLTGDYQSNNGDEVKFRMFSLDNYFRCSNSDLCKLDDITKAKAIIKKIKVLSGNHERKLEIVEVEIVNREYANIKVLQEKCADAKTFNWEHIKT